MMQTLGAPGPAAARGRLDVELTTRAMGGSLVLRVACTDGDAERAERDLRRVSGRIDAWSRRLSRYDAGSDICALNVDPLAPSVPLRPTLAAVLEHAQDMLARTEGRVDVSLLDERLAAEWGDHSEPPARHPWQLRRDGRGGVLLRQGRSRIDLDGVAKGWLADRALRLLDPYPGALVDADGDVAMRPPPDDAWLVAIGHPFDAGADLVSLRPPTDWPARRMGIATSGTSVHQWRGPAGTRHHLIDPRTGRPANTDVIQATVVAESAAVAECLAKSVVIDGSRRGLELAERAGAWAAVALLEDGGLVATHQTSRWLA